MILLLLFITISYSGYPTVTSRRVCTSPVRERSSPSFSSSFLFIFLLCLPFFSSFSLPFFSSLFVVPRCLLSFSSLFPLALPSLSTFFLSPVSLPSLSSLSFVLLSTSNSLCSTCLASFKIFFKFTLPYYYFMTTFSFDYLDSFAYSSWFLFLLFLHIFPQHFPSSLFFIYFLHICWFLDVSHFLHPDTAMDKEASHRSTSTYLVGEISVTCTDGVRSTCDVEVRVRYPVYTFTPL